MLLYVCPLLITTPIYLLLRIILAKELTVRAALVVYAHIVQTIDYAFCFLAVLVSFEHIFYNRCFYGIYRPMLVYNVVTE